MSVSLRPEFPSSPSNLPIGHNGRPATRVELEFALANFRNLGKEYRTLMLQNILNVNENITRGRVLRSKFDRCALEAEASIVQQLQDIIEGMNQ